MKKILNIGLLMFFIQSFIFRGLFTILDSYTPSGKSGNLMVTTLGFIATIIWCLIIVVVILIEKYAETSFKNIILFLLYVHCLFLFYWEAFFEYHLFNDSKSFDTSSIVIILIYFVFELAFTFYVVNRLYKEEEE